MSRDFHISPNYKASDWSDLRPLLAEDGNRKAWADAIAILRDRLESRFFTPIARLRDAADSADLGFGFAMVTLDCLLIDTMESFREDRVKGGETSTKKAFVHFFSNSKVLQKEFPSNTFIGRFYDSIRCGLMHDGETRNGWLVHKENEEKEIIKKFDGGHILYRDHFHEEILAQFERYADELLSGGSPLLRENFLKRMDAICGFTAVGVDHVFYFAYGSNMYHDQMTSRAPSAALQGVARLSDFRLVFNKRGKDGTAKANIESSLNDGAYVLGALYRLPQPEFDYLYAFERGYSSTAVQVHQNGATVLANTFVADPESLYCGQPSHSYLNTILEGATGLNLSSEYRAFIKKAGGLDQGDCSERVESIQDTNQKN